MPLLLNKFELKVSVNEEGKSEIPAYPNISSPMKIQQRTGKPNICFLCPAYLSPRINSVWKENILNNDVYLHRHFQFKHNYNSIQALKQTKKMSSL